jgi:hypothetical protein
MIVIYQNQKYTLTMSKIIMSDYNLNEIENDLNTGFFFPVKILASQQLNFTSDNDVRVFAKGPGNLPVHIMVNRMMESFFGHYSTCANVDHQLLTVMFGKLFLGWVNKMVQNNNDVSDTDIHEKRISFDQHHRLGNDDVKKIIVNHRLAFHAEHRTRFEIELLLSKYFFKVASCYFTVPHNYSKEVQIKYIKLRVRIIEQWAALVGDTTVRVVKAEVWFKQIDALNVAMDYFPQGIELSEKELNKRLQKFINWHKKAAVEALETASETSDLHYRQSVINEWDAALLYAKSLHDGMMKTYHEMEGDEEENGENILMASIVDNNEVEEFLRKQAMKD